jgi:hypothetical protein
MRPIGSGSAGRRHREAAMRVVIAEDTVLLLEGLTRLLEEAGVEVCACAVDAEGFLRAVDAEHPDAVIIDVRMPPTFTKKPGGPIDAMIAAYDRSRSCDTSKIRIPSPSPGTTQHERVMCRSRGKITEEDRCRAGSGVPSGQ